MRLSMCRLFVLCHFIRMSLKMQKKKKSMWTPDKTHKDAEDLLFSRLQRVHR